MAVGDKHEALMKQDLGVPDGVATLDENGVLAAAQWPSAADLRVAPVGIYHGDMNALVINGFYRVGENANLPTPIYHGQVIVSQGFNSDTVIQIGVAYGQGIMVYRGANIVDGVPVWYKWNEVANTDYVDALKAKAVKSTGDNPVNFLLNQCGRIINSDARFPANYGVYACFRSREDGVSGCYALHLYGKESIWYQITSDANEITLDGWIKLATTDYALPRDGSAAMTGSLYIAPDGYSRAELISTTAEIQVRAYNSDWAKRRFIHIPTEVSGSGYNDLQFVNMEANARYTILHTGNKPSGSYTGNGDATSRTIETGGIGSYIAILHDDYLTIVGPSGAIGKNGTSVFGLPYSALRFNDGVLTLNTSDASVNANQLTHYYQVL